MYSSIKFLNLNNPKSLACFKFGKLFQSNIDLFENFISYRKTEKHQLEYKLRYTLKKNEELFLFHDFEQAIFTSKLNIFTYMRNPEKAKRFDSFLSLMDLNFRLKTENSNLDFSLFVH